MTESKRGPLEHNEFEKLVTAALKVDPKGLSGKHKNESDYGQREALKINEVLYSKGYSASQATEWWNTSSPTLNSLTPLQVFRSEESPSQETIEAVRNAAESELPKSKTQS